MGDLLKGSIRERLDEGTYLVFLYKWKIQKATEGWLQDSYSACFVLNNW